MKIVCNNQNQSAGFSLIENVVSLTIVAVMLTSLYASFASGFSTVRVSRENMRATQILLTKLESVRVSSYDKLTNSAYYPASFTEYFDPKDKAAGGAGVVYQGAYTASVPAVGTLPESYRTNMLLITVSLNWTAGNTQHTRSMQTYAARDGMAGFVSVGQ